MVPMIEKPVPWPNGAKVAASYTFDMDADSILHIVYPEDAAQKVSCMTMLRYGPDIAVPRICKLFESFGMKITFFIPAWCIEEHPKAVERILKGGHEIGHHGYLHEKPFLLSGPEEEEQLLVKAVAIIQEIAGVRALGSRTPSAVGRMISPSLPRSCMRASWISCCAASHCSRVTPSAPGAGGGSEVARFASAAASFAVRARSRASRSRSRSASAWRSASRMPISLRNPSRRAFSASSFARSSFCCIVMMFR